MEYPSDLEEDLLEVCEETLMALISFYEKCEPGATNTIAALERARSEIPSKEDIEDTIERFVEG